MEAKQEDLCSEERRVLVSASGTGGHIFPALHIMRELKEQQAKILFVGAGRPLEGEILDPYNIKRRSLSISGIKNLGIKGFFSFMFKLPGAFISCWQIFSEFRPQVVIGVGGYATFLPVIIARIRGVPSWIHECELKAGLANYVLSFFATRISTAFKETKIPGSGKQYFTGQPVRRELLDMADSNECTEERRPKRILIVGGSQGARALDQAILALIPFFEQEQVEIWHQCRREDLEQIQIRYAKSVLKVKVEPFISNMAKAYRWSDVVVSRAGAGAVMELGIVNRPAILVPFPFAQADHQLINANELVNAGKALLVEEGEDFQDRLKAAFIKLLNLQNFTEMKKRRYKGRPVDAAKIIASESLSLAEEN